MTITVGRPGRPCADKDIGNRPTRRYVAGMTETWTAPRVDRVSPSLVAGERESLEQWLDFHRATLLMKCAGLDDERLKLHSVLPSTLSLLGLVRHMAEVERWWFRIHAAGEDVGFIYCTDDNLNADFDDIRHADAAADLEVFEQEVEAARKAVAGKGLDDTVTCTGHQHVSDTRDIRWIYVHMIEEYARHNGHADLLREAIDGKTGE
jgi:uncharacterized damage-inducible protein DinB